MLSTTEAEYVALSNLLNEIKDSINIAGEEKAEFKCTVHEYNLGCIELAKCPKMRPRIKHIAINYHHFRSRVEDGSTLVQSISTNDQQADILTKNLCKKKFLDLRMLICGC
eukprot:7040778-Ditylum_brightwellii.AAC.1